ncbi:hypothetical protein N7493_005464 [Penicillium malachiteum]|uniref:Uncharacterized protein n=1 Tax=Penicillium malachiteum TaxID=1324776 RepID=A0AAD6HMN7_9EURO|nr:hypothetical protein N7493_005464 [Penicillium malachiteum]
MSFKIPEENIDNVLRHVIPHIEAHAKSQAANGPFILGLTGLQGSGKSTWTDALVDTLRNRHNYKTINISLDDLYLDHDDLVRVRLENPQNKLLQTRGQPGTHDTELSVSFFKSVRDSSQETLLPSFDKSLFNGEGGRVPFDKWQRISSGEIIDIVVFEGWCVGFQPLEEDQVRSRWNGAVKGSNQSGYVIETLKDHAIEHLLEVNGSLRQYCELFMGPGHFDYLVHLDTDDLVNVYEWRIQQEHALWQWKNRGMSDEEVVSFVRGYMPAYELYLDQLRAGLFSDDKDKGQLRLILDKERKVTNIYNV